MSLDAVLKLRGLELSCNTANNVANATYVRVYVPAAALITVAYANGVNYGSFTALGNNEYILVKKPTDTVQGTSCNAVSIGFN
jgi:hypothetical protein